MFAERFRMSWWPALTLAPLVVMASPSSPELTEFAPYMCREPVNPNLDLEVSPHLTPPADPSMAEILYRRGDFAGAANAARPYDRNLAELYDQLAVQWAVGWSVESTPAEALPSLREAAKLDTVLGGRYSVVINERLRSVVPSAAVYYYEHHDYPAARHTVELADLMGMRDATIELVEHELNATK